MNKELARLDGGGDLQKIGPVPASAARPKAQKGLVFKSKFLSVCDRRRTGCKLPSTQSERRIITVHPAASSPRPKSFVKPEPFSRPVTLLDAQRYYEIVELARWLEAQIGHENELRSGRCGQSSRGLLLVRALHYAKRLSTALAPLASLETTVED
jgi:hypothetical protein